MTLGIVSSIGSYLWDFADILSFGAMSNIFEDEEIQPTIEINDNSAYRGNPARVIKYTDTARDNNVSDIMILQEHLKLNNTNNSKFTAIWVEALNGGNDNIVVDISDIAEINAKNSYDQKGRIISAPKSDSFVNVDGDFDIILKSNSITKVAGKTEIYIQNDKKNLIQPQGGSHSIYINHPHSKTEVRFRDDNYYKGSTIAVYQLENALPDSKVFQISLLVPAQKGALTTMSALKPLLDYFDNMKLENKDLDDFENQTRGLSLEQKQRAAKDFAFYQSVYNVTGEYTVLKDEDSDHVRVISNTEYDRSKQYLKNNPGDAFFENLDAFIKQHGFSPDKNLHAQNFTPYFDPVYKFDNNNYVLIGNIDPNDF